MKRLLLITSFWIVIIVSANANIHTLYTGNCYEYTDFFGFISHNFTLIYDDNTKLIKLRTSGNIKKAYVDLQWYDIRQINKSLEKYFEWETIAVENEVELDKDLPGSPIKTKVNWDELDCYYSSSNFLIDLIFLSMDKQHHCFFMVSSKVSGPYNVSSFSFKFIFDKNQAEDFYKGINEQNLKNQIAEIEKQKEKSKELFN